MPMSLAAWKIPPSTSILTALVHSSSSANLGLCDHNTVEPLNNGNRHFERGTSIIGSA